MCGVWVALEDIDMDCGPLVYYPGSHKLPEVTLTDIGVTADASNYPKYEDYIENLIEDRVAEMLGKASVEPEYGLLRKGQALIWSANLLHGGAARRDERRTRHSQVTHCFFEGCRYYTPMLSTESATHWRNPEWITREGPEPDLAARAQAQKVVSALRGRLGSLKRKLRETRKG